MSIPSLLPVLLLAPALPGGSNQLVNPGAESGDLSGWSDPSGNGFAVYGGPQGAFEGDLCFQGGATGPSGPYTNEILQDIDVAALAASIDAAQVTSRFEGWARSNSAGTATDHARVLVEFLASGGGALATFDSGNVVPTNQWNRLADVRQLPPGTRTVRVRLRGTRAIGQSTDAFFDALSWTSELGERHCTSTVNSSGSAATVHAEGSPSLADDQLSLVARGVPNTPGVFFHGTSRVQVPFGDGLRCVGGTVVRLRPLVQGSGNSADLALDLSPFAPGDVRGFQYWFRDGAAGGAGFNLSDAVDVRFE